MNPNDKNYGGQGFDSGRESEGRLRSDSFDSSFGSSSGGSDVYGSRSLGPQDHLEADAILQESYVVQPELDVESMDVSDIEVGSSFRPSWLLWGGVGLGLGLLAFRLVSRNRFVIQERFSSLREAASDRLNRFRGEEEDDSLVLQENPRPDMVSEGISDYSSETPSYQSAPISSPSTGMSAASLDVSGFGNESFQGTSVVGGADQNLSNPSSPSSGFSGLEDDRNLGRS